MSLAQHSRRAVERRLTRLRDEFGEFPVTGRTVENSPTRFGEGGAYIEVGHVGAAGALVRLADGLLLVYHGESRVWGTPGGGHEPGESLAETAVREVREKTGVTCRPTDVFYAEQKRFVHETDPERRGYLLELVFDAEYIDGTPDASTDDEVQAAAWFAEPPEPLYGPLALGSGVWKE